MENKFVDFYELLGLSHDAEVSSIKQRCQEMLIKSHPDKVPDSENMFLQVCEARKILLDPEEKKKYDRIVHEYGIKKLCNEPYERVSLSDLELVDDGSEYMMVCRCGGLYSVPNDHSTERKEKLVVFCDSCSYHIEVISTGDG